MAYQRDDEDDELLPGLQDEDEEELPASTKDNEEKSDSESDPDKLPGLSSLADNSQTGPNRSGEQVAQDDANRHPVLPPIKPQEQVAEPIFPKVGDQNAFSEDTLLPRIGAVPTLPTLSKEEQSKLPLYSAGRPQAEPASREAYIQDLENMRDKPTYAQRHPGVLGKIVSVLGKVGNAAGDILGAPEMALIPGTDLYNARRRGADVEGINQSYKNDLDRSETIKNLNPPSTAKTPEEIALAARQRIVAATQSGQKPDPRDEATWTAFSDVKQAGQDVKPTPEGQKPLGDKIGALNQSLTRRYQILNPGQALPDDLTLGKDATADDFKRVDGLLKDTESAQGTAAQRQFAQSERTKSDAILETLRAGQSQDRQDKKDAAKEKAGEEIVSAADSNGTTHFVSRGDAETNGWKVTGKADSKAVNDSEAGVRNINIMDQSAGTLRNDIPLIDKMGIIDKGIANHILSKASEVKSASELHDLVQSFVASGEMGALSENSRHVVQDILQMRESALGLGKLETGGSRATSQAIDAINSTLPGRLTNSKDAARQLDAFTERMDNLKRSYADVPARGVTYDNAPKAKKSAQGSDNPGSSNYPADVKVPTGWSWTTQNGQQGITDGTHFKPYKAK